MLYYIFSNLVLYLQSITHSRYISVCILYIQGVDWYNIHIDHIVSGWHSSLQVRRTVGNIGRYCSYTEWRVL